MAKTAVQIEGLSKVTRALKKDGVSVEDLKGPADLNSLRTRCK